MAYSVNVTVEYLGGLDQIMGGQKEAEVVIESGADGSSPTMVDLLEYIVQNHLEDQSDKCMLVQEESVRPGVLVLINDTDWELEGEMEYELEDGDTVTFTSTLHGG